MRQIDFSRLRLTGLIMIRNVYNQLSSRPPRHLEVVCLENVLEFEDRVDNRDHAPWIESPASEPATHKDAYNIEAEGGVPLETMLHNACMLSFPVAEVN